MKKFLIIMLMGCLGKATFAQDRNPQVSAGIVAPAPMLQGVGSIQFVAGNTGGDALDNLAQPMVLIVSLSNGIPNNANPVAAISGTIANKFTWLYDASIRTYQGTQNAVIGGLELGTIVISYRITTPSSLNSPSNGFNVNVTPPGYTNGSNAIGDDNASSYTFGNSGILPVKLLSYNVAISNCVSTISWKSGVEGNFSHYEVEYSKDGSGFVKVATVNSKGDNSIYSMTHNPQQGNGYYRLKLVDLDGKIEYSRIIVLNVQCGKGSVLVYPNPTSDFLNVSISGADAKGTMATLYNAAGQSVLSRNLQNGSNQLDVSRLASGVYQLKLVSTSGTENIKVVID
jgi:hypothetical protein